MTAAGSKLGQVLDLSKVEKQALARYTNDEGNHVLLEVHPAATLVPQGALRILFIADVFGAAGRRAVESRLPGLREELAVDFCIVNGENAADGRGITAKIVGAHARGGRRRDHARELGLGPAGLRALPLGLGPRDPAGEHVALLARAAGSPSTTASP